MEATTCPECTNEVTETDTSCPRCGASLASDEPHAPPLMSIVSEAAPPATGAILFATRAAAVIFIGCLGLLAALAWKNYADGYVDTLLPAWNTVVMFGMVPIAVGVFRRRIWAQRWVLCTAALTALSLGMSASRSGSTVLWTGALLLGAVAIVMAKTKDVFRHDDSHRGTLPQVIAMVALIGSFVVYFSVGENRGTERGRKAFAAEVQDSYAKAGTDIRAYIEGRTLVLESAAGTDEQIDALAQDLHTMLKRNGDKAKVWVLGFDAIEVKNGSHEQRLAPADPP